MPITEADQDGNLRIRLQHSKCVFLLNLFTHALKIHLLRASYVLGNVQGAGDTEMAEAVRAPLGLGGQQTPALLLHQAPSSLSASTLHPQNGGQGDTC